MLLGVVGFFVALVATAVVAPFVPALWPWLAAGLALKALGDLWVLVPAVRRFGQRRLLAVYPVHLVLHAPHSLVVVVLGPLGGFEWKGRRARPVAPLAVGLAGTSGRTATASGAPLAFRLHPPPVRLTVQRLRDSLLPRALGPLISGAVVRGPERGIGRRPLLYVTIDDGPDPEGTPRWLETLDRLHARAVFFLSADRTQRWPDAVRQILAAGHRVGNHGGPHVSAWRTRPSWALARSRKPSACWRISPAGQSATCGRPTDASRPGWCAGPSAVGGALVLWDVMPGDFLAVSHRPSTLRARS